VSTPALKLDPYSVDLRCGECGMLSSGSLSVRGFRKQFRDHLLSAHPRTLTDEARAQQKMLGMWVPGLTSEGGKAWESAVDSMTEELMEIAKYYRVTI